MDAEGGFEFPLCEGVRYSVYAYDHEPLNSAPTAFTAAKELPEIVLTLDKTSNELEKLLNAIAASPATAPTPPASR